jgi:hypothetical protein
MRAVRSTHLGVGLGRQIFQLSSQVAFENGVKCERRSIVGRKNGPCLYSERLIAESFKYGFVLKEKRDFEELYPTRQFSVKAPLIVTLFERTCFYEK